jgi:hypothetical protein
MRPEKFLVLFERCLQLIETVPPERRGMLIEVAPQCLRLAEENMAPAEPGHRIYFCDYSCGQQIGRCSFKASTSNPTKIRTQTD